jgi:predicted nucleotidyltransferase
MLLQAVYPTPEHKAAAKAIVDFVTTNYRVDAVLLVNSCARGKATRDSCLDISVLARPESRQSQLDVLEADWDRFEETNPAVAAMKRVRILSVLPQRKTWTRSSSGQRNAPGWKNFSWARSPSM